MKLKRIMNHQSCQGGGRKINTDTSLLKQSGEGEIDFRDKSTVVDGNSNKIRAAYRGKPFRIKAGSIPRSHGISNL